jgi:chitin disaccharide deacetylase
MVEKRQMSYLIINADDFGWDEDTTQVTIELLENRLLTSATIMANRPCSALALEYARENQNDFSFGLHFNIVDGDKPLSTYDTYSLVDDAGLFKPANMQILNALFCNLNVKDIQAEFEHQLNVLLEYGIMVSHIDSHGHLHKLPLIAMAIKPIMNKYNIKRIRRPQNIFCGISQSKNIVNNAYTIFIRSLYYTDYFYMLRDHDNIDWFNDFFSNLKPGTTELGIHPGKIEPWRAVETTPLSNGLNKTILLHKGITLINYNDINR